MLLSVAGIRINVEESGAGRPVVFLHGFGGRASNWHPQVESLADRWRVLAIDLRGFGRSERSEGSLAISDYADDVAGVLDALGIGGCTIVGLSMGGMIAQELALRRPDRVGALVLADTTCRVADATREFNEALARTALASGAGAVADAVVPGSFTADSVAEGRECVRAFDRSVRETTPLVLAQALRAIIGLDLHPHVCGVRVPTLVLCGEHDPMRPDSDLLRETIPRSVLEIVRGAGHVSNMEQPERFTGAVRGFLERWERGLRDE